MSRKLSRGIDKVWCFSLGEEVGETESLLHLPGVGANVGGMSTSHFQAPSKEKAEPEEGGFKTNALLGSQGKEQQHLESGPCAKVWSVSGPPTLPILHPSGQVPEFRFGLTDEKTQVWRQHTHLQAFPTQQHFTHSPNFSQFTGGCCKKDMESRVKKQVYFVQNLQVHSFEDHTHFL